jgi:WD40 repeat protein
MAAATVTRVGPLPWIDRLLLAPEATLALAFVRTASAQGGGLESTVSAIAIDRGQVVWRASVPASRGAEVGRSDAGRVLAFGNDWIRLWQGATGESLFDSIAVLKQLPAEQPPVAIVDVASLKDRVFVVYGMKAGKQFASIDMNSGRVLNSTQLSGSSAIGFQTWWSPDRKILLVASPDSLSLWDTDTLRLIGDLNPQPGPSRLFAEFDASGELLATMRYSAEGLDRHVVITDVRTRTPVGQCLLGDADAMHLASDGRTVLGYQGNRLLFCRRDD